MREFLDGLKDYMDEDYTLVFPSSHSSRYYKDELAKEFKIAIDDKKIISVDILKSIIASTDNQNISNKFIKKIFAIDFIKNKKDKYIKYLYNQQKTNYNIKISIVAEYIEESFRVLATKKYDNNFYSVLDKSLINDLELIKEEYNKFLKKNNLKDPLVDLYGNSKNIKDKYCLVFSNTIIDRKLLKYHIPSLKEYNIDKEIILNNRKIKEYENVNKEIYDVLNDVETNLKAGVKPYDIVISLGSWSYYPYLEKVATLKNIKLNPIKGSPLASYKSYRVFNHFIEMYKSNFSFESLKAFILDEAVHLKNKNNYIEFLEDSAKKYKQYGSIDDESKDDYLLDFNKLDKNNLSIYKNLKEIVISFNKVNNLMELKPIIKNIKTKLLDIEFYNQDDNLEVKVFNFIVKQIDIFIESLEKINYKGTEPLFSIFLNEIKIQNYAKDSKEGINIYPYPLANTFFNKHHYILGLSSESSKRMYYKKFSLFDNSQDDRELTNSNIDLACYANNINISYSKKTYGKDDIAPAYFLKENLITKKYNINLSTIYDKEYAYLNNELKELSITEKEKKAITKYIKSYNISRKQDFKNLKGLKPEKKNGKYKVSPTIIDSYVKNPFIYYFEKCLEIEEFKLDNRKLNSFSIGNIIHSVFEKYNKELLKNHIPNKIDEERKKLKHDIINNLTKINTKLDKQNDYYIPPIYLIANNLENYKKALEMYFEGLSLSSGYDTKFNNEKSKLETLGKFVEKWFSYEHKNLKNLIIEGKIDYVFKDEIDRLYVLDYKSGKAPDTHGNPEKNKDWQLYVYKCLLENSVDKNGNKYKVGKGYYFSLKEGFKEVFPAGSKVKEKEFNSKFNDELEKIIKEFFYVLESCNLNNDRVTESLIDNDNKYKTIIRKVYENE